MKEIKIKAKLIGEEEYSYEGIGFYDKEKKIIQYQDNFAHLTLYLKDDILLRETEESILSYKFRLKEASCFQIYIKEYKKIGNLKLLTKKLEKQKNYFSVIYQLEGNDFDHQYEIDWRNKK